MVIVVQGKPIFRLEYEGPQREPSVKEIVNIMNDFGLIKGRHYSIKDIGVKVDPRIVLHVHNVKGIKGIPIQANPEGRTNIIGFLQRNAGGIGDYAQGEQNGK